MPFSTGHAGPTTATPSAPPPLGPPRPRARAQVEGDHSRRSWACEITAGSGWQLTSRGRLARCTSRPFRRAHALLADDLNLAVSLGDPRRHLLLGAAGQLAAAGGPSRPVGDDARGPRCLGGGDAPLRAAASTRSARAPAPACDLSKQTLIAWSHRFLKAPGGCGRGGVVGRVGDADAVRRRRAPRRQGASPLQALPSPESARDRHQPSARWDERVGGDRAALPSSSHAGRGVPLPSSHPARSPSCTREQAAAA